MYERHLRFKNYTVFFNIFFWEQQSCNLATRDLSGVLKDSSIFFLYLILFEHESLNYIIYVQV